jgi:integrase
MSRKANPLLAFARQHGGHLRAIERKKRGISYMYYYSRGGMQQNFYFPAGIDDEHIKERIIEIQRELVYERAGMLNKIPQRKAPPEICARQLGKKLIAEIDQEKLKPATIERKRERYEYTVECFAEYLKDRKSNVDFQLGRVEREDLEEFKEYLIANDFSPLTVNTLLKALKAMFKQALRHGLLENMPFMGLHYMRVGVPKKKSTLTLAEMREVTELNYLRRNPDVRLAWNIARFTGMHVRDMMRLERKEIDLRNECFHFKIENRIVEMPFHHELVKYFTEYFAEKKIVSGLIFEYRKLGFSHEIRHAITLIKRKRIYGSDTPRDSLRHYLEKSAKWSSEWIELFLKRPKQPLPGKIMMQLRRMINQLPIDQ